MVYSSPLQQAGVFQDILTIMFDGDTFVLKINYFKIVLTANVGQLCIEGLLHETSWPHWSEN